MSVTCGAQAAADTGELVGHGGEPLLTDAEEDEGWDLGTKPLTSVSKGNTQVARNKPTGGCWLKGSADLFDK